MRHWVAGSIAASANTNVKPRVTFMGQATGKPGRWAVREAQSWRPVPITSNCPAPEAVIGVGILPRTK